MNLYGLGDFGFLFLLVAATTVCCAVIMQRHRKTQPWATFALAAPISVLCLMFVIRGMFNDAINQQNLLNQKTVELQQARREIAQKDEMLFLFSEGVKNLQRDYRYVNAERASYLNFIVNTSTKKEEPNGEESCKEESR
jgi:hypothetical protein